MLPGFPSMRMNAGIVVEFVDHSTAPASPGGIEAPSDIQAGDLLIHADFVTESDDTPTTPTGFTTLESGDDSGSTGISVVLSAKVADGTEGGTVIVGMDLADKILAVYRASTPIVSFTPFSGNVEITGGNPASQSVLIGANLPPLLIFGMYCIYVTGPGTQTFSPSEDATLVADGFGGLYLKYKIYNSSPQDTTIDLDEPDTSHALVSTGLALSF